MPASMPSRRRRRRARPAGRDGRSTKSLRVLLLPLAFHLPGAAAIASPVEDEHRHHHNQQQQQQQQHQHQQQQERHRNRRSDLGFQNVDLLPQGFTPRYPALLELESAHSNAHLAKRDGECGANSHDCLDIGHPERCCTNDTYCYINKDSDPKCCPIGSNCVDDSYCSSDAFFCTSTLPTTAMHTRTLTGSSSAAESSPTTTTPPEPSVLEGCCQRACPQTSFYLCPKSLGGNCCPFGSDCAVGGDCVSTKTAGAAPRQSPKTGGACATGQIRCNDGNGCCDADAVCTAFHGGAFCASQTPRAQPESTISFNSPAESLKPGAASTAGDQVAGSSDAGSGASSSGRTIGLAVGLSLGILLVLALIAWRLLLHLRRKRRAIESLDSSARDEPPMTPAANAHDTNLVQGLLSPSLQAPEPVFPPGIAELPVLHEPNGPGAEPVEIDSTEVMEAAHGHGHNLNHGRVVELMSAPPSSHGELSSEHGVLQSAPSEHGNLLSPMSPLSQPSEPGKSPTLRQRDRVSSLSAAARTTSWAVSIESGSEP